MPTTAGHSHENVAAIKKLGVRKLVQERALVEAGIGAVKSSRYNFHRPRAKSVRMMGTCGQLGALGFTLNKLVRGFAARLEMQVVG